MFVKHLQEYLDQFTNGKRGNAISNARIYMQMGGHLEEINEAHKKLNGKLRKELEDVRKTLAGVS